MSLWQGCDWSFLIGPWIADAKKWCGKRPLSEPFLHFKTIVLPRQARDKHNETLTNEAFRYVFCRRANATDAPENYYEWQARSQVSTWWPVAPSDEDKQTKNYTSGPPLDGCALHLPPAAHPHTPPSSGHTHTHTHSHKRKRIWISELFSMVSRAAAVPLLCYALATTMQQQRRRRRHTRRREQALERPDWRLLQGPRAVLRRSGEHYIYIYALSVSESFKSKTNQFAKTGSGQKRLRKDIELKFHVSTGLHQPGQCCRRQWL